MATVKKKELPVGRSVRVESGEIFIIQKDIPMLGVRSMGAALRYPFNQMNPGESFEIKSNPNEVRKVVSRVSSACASYVKRNNKASKFTVRRTALDSVRVWRIK